MARGRAGGAGGAGGGGGRGKELALASFYLLEHAVFFVVACRSLKIFRAKGVRGVYAATFKALRNLPGVEAFLQRLLSREVEGAVRRLSKTQSQIAREAAKRPVLRLPLEGVAGKELLAQLECLKKQEASRPSLSYVHTAEGGAMMTEHCQLLLRAFRQFCEKSGLGGKHGGGELDRVLEVAFQAFVCENGVNPTNPALVPAVRRIENEVLAMTAALFHGDEEVVGALCSGTQESILLAVKAYRDMARKLQPQVTDPEMVVPVTAHPAFVKAGALFNVRVVHVPVGPDSRVSLDAVEAALSPSTILIVASAPQYPHGVIDPIPQLADLALQHDVPLHVDACYGGLLLPFLEKLGKHEITPWDFRCEGVASISADFHKYGWAIKGTGVVLYRSAEIREFQYFTYLDWPGGVFGSPSLVGTRPGGNVAATWVAMMALGESGYLSLAKACVEVWERLKEGVRRIQGLGLVAEPEFVSMAILSRDPKVDILLVGDAMEERGWHMERQQSPSSLHLSVMPQHQEVADRFLLDLQASVENVRRRGARAIKQKGKATIYKVVESLPDRALMDDFIRKFYSETHRTSPTDQLIMSSSSHSLTALNEEDEDDEEEGEGEGEEDDEGKDSDSAQ